MGKKERVTIKQVAIQAGVSKQTVSRVINHRRDVSADTRQLVEEVMARLGYPLSAVGPEIQDQNDRPLKYTSTIKKERVTIKRVAEQAGVSTMTVSRVLNQQPDVAADTRDRVEQVIVQLGYHPSALARSMIQQRSYTLGVVIAGLKFIGPSRTLNGITQKAEELGYSLLLKELPRFDTTDVQPLLMSLLARQVDGIIWAVSEIGDNHQWLHKNLPELPVPVVLITTQNYSGFSTVDVDNYAGARLAVDHLLQQGYRAIGHISGPLDWWESRMRKQGWLDTLSAAGLPALEQFSVEGNWSSASGETAIQHLFEQYPQMDAVFVANDQMAISVLREAHLRGLHVPSEFGVVGFDNIPDAAYLLPSLTTIFQDLNSLGCLAVSKAVETIEAAQNGVLLEPEFIAIQPELIVRESSLRQAIVSNPVVPIGELNESPRINTNGI